TPRPPPPATPARQLVPPVVALSLGAGAARGGGPDRLELLLEPAELGRVEIRVEPGSGPEGAIAVRVVAERPETLALLQRDARELDRALAQAGLGAAGATGGGCVLSFALGGGTRQQGGGADAGAGGSGGAARRGLRGAAAAEAPAATVPPRHRPLLALLDIAV
ncbi:flagellar hook-length control protein FliK, partial [Caldovatus aquaticus]